MNMPSALIGYTGFVGSTLLRTKAYDKLYNSKNIDEIRDQSFSTVICAGVSAVKWWANKHPSEDRIAIDGLVDNLSAIKTDHFILISTVDVYSRPIGVTELDVPDLSAAQPYGRHRRALEIWASERFARCTIVRLPGLFGHGLKKNLIYDLMVNNQPENISPNGVLQWYPMERFADDLDLIVESNVDLINIAPKALSTSTIASRLFPGVAIGPADMPGPVYDMQTIHSSLLGGEGAYHLGGEAVLDAMANFVGREPK